MNHRGLAFVLFGALWVLASRDAAAQTRPTVFLHGFGAEASDWAATADRLTARVRITPHLPALPWRDPFEKQAKALQGQAGIGALPTTAVVVGHSNGGVVAREWSRLRPLGGIVTIGTPHRGVPLLGNLPIWAAFAGTLRGIVADAGRTFIDESQWLWVLAVVENALRLASDFSMWSLVNLISVVGLSTTMPVAIEMLPGSSYLNGLNASSQLSREASAVPNRVGIVSIASNYYYAGPARAIAPQKANTIATTMYATASTLLYWGNHILINADPADIAAIDQGLSLIGVANHILSIDPVYCRVVSTPDQSACVPNDGIVPVTSQAYPGAPNLTIQGPAHREEKQRGDDALYAALVNYMRLSPVTSSSSSSPEPSPTPTPVPDGDDPEVIFTGGELDAGSELGPGHMVSSRDRRVHLLYQADGNLVLYYGDEDEPDEWRALWASGTAGTSPGFVILQLDGNLVVYSASSRPLWSSGTSGSGFWLAVQNDGNLVIYDANDNARWASNTSVE